MSSEIKAAEAALAKVQKARDAAVETAGKVPGLLSAARERQRELEHALDTAADAAVRAKLSGRAPAPEDESLARALAATRREVAALVKASTESDTAVADAVTAVTAAQAALRSAQDASKIAAARAYCEQFRDALEHLLELGVGGDIVFAGFEDLSVSFTPGEQTAVCELKVRCPRNRLSVPIGKKSFIRA